MLESKNLDVTRYQELYDKATAHLLRLVPNWTELRPHDPSVTILETMALLSDFQNYECNAVEECHLLKYLKLLGVQPQEISPAHAYLTVVAPMQEKLLPAGSQFWAEEIPFETEKTFTLLPNQIDALLIASKGKLQKWDSLLKRQEGQGIPVFTESGDTLLLSLEHPLPIGNTVSLYVETIPCAKRHPPDRETPVTALQWEFYAEGGWRELKVEDETASLLDSGYLHIILPLPMKPFLLAGKQRYLLRARVVNGDYDLPPLLKQIRLNILPVTQKKTLVQTLTLQGSFPQTVSARLCREEMIRVFVPATDGMWQELREGFWWSDDVNGNRMFHLNDTHWNRVRLVCADSSYHYENTITGVTSQRVSVNAAGVLPESLSIMLQEKDSLWRDYQVFSHPQGGETIWGGCLHLPQNNEILFGDGGDFAIPHPAPNGLLITGLSVTLGGEGNVPALSIQSGAVSCVNDTAAVGGRDSQTALSVRQTLQTWMEQPQRAVTREDYQRITMETPGLALQKAVALPHNLLHKGETGMAVVVKPCGKGKPPLLPHAKKLIWEHLEPFRLLTVRLEVLGPRYLPIRVEVHAALEDSGNAREQELKQLILKMTDGVEGELDFGETVSHARLFSKLSALPFVRSVKLLRLDTVGNAGKRMRNGDILPEPDSLTWLEDFRLVLL